MVTGRYGVPLLGLAKSIYYRSIAFDCCNDRISQSAMLYIPPPGICYPRKTNKLKSDIRHSASRYLLPKEDRVS